MKGTSTTITHPIATLKFLFIIFECFDVSIALDSDRKEHITNDPSNLKTIKDSMLVFVKGDF